MFLNASDEQLARTAQLGDQDAFFALYNRYLQRVYNRVRSKIPPQDVDDVTQEVFLAVVRSLDSYEQRARFNTWLYTIVNRQIADFYRRRSRSHRLASAELDDETEDVAAASVQESADQRIAIQRALDKLPQHYQDIIALRFLDGLSFSEIAEQRGQTLEAVKSLYRRAVQALRDELGDI
jgi:RNA polymerase sigma-70 factor (ECF subfamily)